MARDSRNGANKKRLAELVDLHGDKRGTTESTIYPYPQILPLDRFDSVADELGLCRQERRVTMGRVLHFSLPDIAQRMKLSLSTVRGYDRSARQRAGCTHGGELVRRVLALLFSE